MRREWENVILVLGFWLISCRGSFWAVVLVVSPLQGTDGWGQVSSDIVWGKARRKWRGTHVSEWLGGLEIWDVEVTSRTPLKRTEGQGSGVSSLTQSGLSYIGSWSLCWGMKPCFPGAVPRPCCQHRCAFWWRPAALCTKPRQWNLSLEQDPVGKRAILGECVPAALWPLAQEMLGSIQSWLDRLWHLCMEIRVREFTNHRETSTPTP